MTQGHVGLVFSLLLFAGASAAAPSRLQKNESLAVMAVSERGLNVKLLKAKRPHTRQIICRDGYRNSAIEGQLKSYSLHPTLPLVLLHCQFLAHCHESDRKSLCNPFFVTSKSYLIHARFRRKIEVRRDFTFSPVKGHALFVEGPMKPIFFVPAKDLNRKVFSRGHRGGRRKIKLSSVPADPKSASTLCPQRANRDHTLTGWSWLPDDTLRLHVTYCWRYRRLVDYCPATDSLQMVTEWVPEGKDPFPDRIPSACGSMSNEGKPGPAQE